MTLAEELLNKHHATPPWNAQKIIAAINEAIERCAQVCDDKANGIFAELEKCPNTECCDDPEHDIDACRCNSLWAAASRIRAFREGK